MSWKKYKEFFKTHKAEEFYFVLGLDIGNQTSSIAFYNPLSRAPEIIDMSGGYGKSSTPTALQYVPETDDWVFGEYAVLNSGIGGDIFFCGLVEKLGKKDYLEIDSRPISVSSLLSIYVKELIGNCKNLNPKAEIAGIIVSVPSYISEEAKHELMNVMAGAGYDKHVISLVPDRECIFNKYYFNKPVISENILLLDFGGREIRGGVYNITPSDVGAKIKSLSSMFDKRIGTQVIDEAITAFFSSYYEEKSKTPASKFSEQLLSQLNAFTYQHKDLLFQKNKVPKPVKLYYNFVYPPLQQQISPADIENIMRPFYNRFTLFLSEILKKAEQDGKPISKSSINTVICVGGGFEMQWAREMVQKTLPLSEIVFYKNSKGVIAEGASIIAASKLGVLSNKEFNYGEFKVEDTHQIKSDIGVKVVHNKKEQFIPLIERNAFWWQSPEPKNFVVNEPTDHPISIELFKRDESGEILLLDKLVIEGLPKRPVGTTKIKMSLEFSSQNKLTATVNDMGFGELFPVSDYSQKFMIKL